MRRLCAEKLSQYRPRVLLYELGATRAVQALPAVNLTAVIFQLAGCGDWRRIYESARIYEWVQDM